VPNSKESCSICLEEFNADQQEVFAHEGQHGFHRACIQKGGSTLDPLTQTVLVVGYRFLFLETTLLQELFKPLQIEL
jgi:hypothetical protein